MESTCSRIPYRTAVAKPAPIQALLHQAVDHHQAGRLEIAEALYGKVVKADPRNAEALNLLGVIAQGRNQLDRAKLFFERAVACGPNIPEIHFNLGNLLSATQNVDGACSAYLRATVLMPEFAAAHLNLGVMLHGAARLEDAVSSFRTVIAIAPLDPRGHFNLGQCLLQLSRPAEAEFSLKRAVELAPDYFDAHLALAVLYEKADRVQDAIAHARQALMLNPLPEYYSNLGDLLRRTGELEPALAALRTALADKPDEPIIWHNYGAALHAERQLDEAQQAFSQALALDPDFIPAYFGLAKVHEFQGAYDKALAVLERGLVFDPKSPDLIFKLSWLHLAGGDLREGWREYAFRNSCILGKQNVQAKRPTPPAFWAGEDLSGKTILILTEQGPGEEILFASMFPEVIARAGLCIIECSPRMVPVFARSFPQAEVRSYLVQEVSPSPLAGVDYQIRAPDLGEFLRPDFNHFPCYQGYLKADTAKTKRLRACYQALAPGRLIVGLSWRSKNEEIGELKSTDLVAWADVLTVPGVTFVNLQYGDCAAELAAVKQRLGVDVFHEQGIDPLKNMDDFVAQVAAMDLVISTSNTTVHVAGALNVPIWLLLLSRPVSMWYWFISGGSSPWYPSLHILRHGAAARGRTWWRDAIARAGRYLGRLASGLR